MNVKELIEILSQQDPEKPIYLSYTDTTDYTVKIKLQAEDINLDDDLISDGVDLDENDDEWWDGLNYVGPRVITFDLKC